MTKSDEIMLKSEKKSWKKQKKNSEKHKKFKKKISRELGKNSKPPPSTFVGGAGSKSWFLKVWWLFFP